MQLGAVPVPAPLPPPTHRCALRAEDGRVGTDGGSHRRQPHTLALRLLLHLRHDDGCAGEVHGRAPALPCGAEMRVSDIRLVPLGAWGHLCPSASTEAEVGAAVAPTYPRSTAARPRQVWWTRRCRCRRGRARLPGAGCPWPPALLATPRGHPAAAPPAPPPAPRALRSEEGGHTGRVSRAGSSPPSVPRQGAAGTAPGVPPRHPRRCSRSA